MAINIPLVGPYRLRSDSNNFIISRAEGDREIYEGFYSTIESALDDFITMKIRGFDSTSWDSLAKSIKLLQTALNKSLHPFNLRVEVEQ